MAAACTQSERPNATFNDHIVYSYAPLLFQELRGTHSPACRKHSMSSNAFLRTQISQIKTSSLPLKKVYLNAVSHFFFHPASTKRALAACAKSRAPRLLRAVKRTLSLGKGVVPAVRAAEKNPSPFTPKYSRQLRMRASSRVSWLDFEPALRTPLHIQRCRRPLRKNYKIMILF